MRKLLPLLLFVGLSSSYGQHSNIPSKIEFDSVLQNAATQMNSSMTGLQVDEFTKLKFVTYDKNPPLFTYFYSTLIPGVQGGELLNPIGIEALKKFNIEKTCSSRFKKLMKPYGLKIAHIFEDAASGRLLFNLTVSHLDCNDAN